MLHLSFSHSPKNVLFSVSEMSIDYTIRKPNQPYQNQNIDIINDFYNRIEDENIYINSNLAFEFPSIH